jgi:hypothetical protein
MPASGSSLSRLYLAPAALALLLGGLSLWHHLNQPKYPPAPGLGCITAKFPSPDSLHIPAAFAELQSCPHISETIFRLELNDPARPYPAWILTATGPENPYAWAKSLRIRWRGLDTLEIEHADAVKFEERTDRTETVHIVYVAEHGELPW